jgi:hypothetical protein
MSPTMCYFLQLLLTDAACRRSSGLSRRGILRNPALDYISVEIPVSNTASSLDENHSWTTVVFFFFFSAREDLQQIIWWQDEEVFDCNHRSFGFTRMDQSASITDPLELRARLL